MNGDERKDIAIRAIALGVGVALGAVLGNERTRKSLVEKSRSWLGNIRQT